MDVEAAGFAAALSRLLVAFTIEVDNEFEQHMPHRTALFGPGGPAAVLPSTGRPFPVPWLASYAMWQNGLRYVPADGVPAGSLQGLGANLNGLLRWGYLRASDQLLRPTAAGRYAQAVWARLGGTVERRWRERFGDDLVSALRLAVLAVTSSDDAPAPLYLPVLAPGMGMRTRQRNPTPAQLVAAGVPSAAEAGLATLLSRALLIFTADYESGSELSLPLTADLLVALTDRAVPVRHVPLRCGISREAAQAALGYLERNGLVVTGADPSSARGRTVSLTSRGRIARDRHGRRWRAVEQGWEDRYGAEVVGELRDVLTAFAGHRTNDEPTLALGLRPYETGWRARGRYRTQTSIVLAEPWAALPRYPMVLHRGGYPDGS